MNKLRPLNKLRYPGYSAQGGVWPTGRYSRRHRMARRLLSLRPVAVCRGSRRDAALTLRGLMGTFFFLAIVLGAR